MSICKKFLICIVVIISLYYTTETSALIGTYNVGSGQVYTSLTGAAGFFNAVNTLGLTGNVTVLITSNIGETGAVSLNQWATAGFTITISPSAATVRIFSGDFAGALFNLNGADNLTIDGRFGGSGRYLRFYNLNNGGTTFRFINDATNNTIRYCTIEGTRVAASNGVVEFSTTTGANGNDNNTIDNCILRDLATGAGMPQNMIVSNGSTTTANTYNSGNTISNNEIFNFYRNGQACSAILLMNGSTSWTISGNSFYQTTAMVPAATTAWNVIAINTSLANNINITNNYLGGSSANMGGTPWSISSGATIGVYFIRFIAAGTTTASSVDGNFIGNITITSTPGSSSVTYFGGILVESGRVNIGSGSGNTIGNTTTNSNISLTYNGTADNLINRGIDHRGTGNIQNNTIGSITIAGTNNRTIRLECIFFSSTPSAAITISGNTIGSSTVSNSIQQTSSTFNFQLTGIYTASNTQTVTVNNNLVSNLRVISTGAASRMRGIYHNRGTNSPLAITNNTVRELYCASSSTDRFPDNTSMVGIFTGSSSVSQTVSGNTISGLYGTGNSDSYVQGFSFYNNAAKGTFEKNRIYNLNHSSTTGAPKIWAINAFWGSWNFYNNQITITNGEPTDNYVQQNNNNNTSINNSGYNNNGPVNPEVERYLAKDPPATDIKQDEKPHTYANTDLSTNGAEIKGIHDEAEFPCLYYYNSVYIGGTATSGSAGSWAYDRPLLAWATSAGLRDNLFFNARTGGTGKHYAMGNEIGSLNWTTTSADYNVYVSSNSNTVATWGVLDRTMQQWRDSSKGDKHTWSTVSTSLSASNLFTSISTGNLKINAANYEAWLVSGKGLAIAGQTTDYEGNARPVAISGGCSDIGSDELTSVPPNNPLATVNNPPGSGVTSTYRLWERTLLTIYWGTGGSSYPSSVNVRYYSGVDPSGVLGGGYSNSYWEVNPVGTLTGANYNITINFGDNETYSISTPSANTRLAKYNGTWEVFSIAGNGTWQSDLDWPNEIITTRDMIGFSDYTLTDGTNPLPVILCSFEAAVRNREVDLNWTTCSEVNNKGFDIEKRIFNPLTNSYYPWIWSGFVEGHGTTNEQQSYSFNDKKLAVGKYQYRLKQIDFNGNHEYHVLTNPSDIIIGKPNNADLFQNYPNPSNPTSKVDFQIPFTSKVSLKVYDITGKEAATLIDAQLDGGYYTAEFNGSNLASGVYFYRLSAVSDNGSSFNKTMKLILIK